MAYRHPRADEITALLATHSTAAIAKQLRVDRGAVRRIRNETGILCQTPRLPWNTAEQKWEAHTTPVDGGHLDWTGERSRTGTPVMRFREKSISPAAIAFRIQHGRDPIGHVRADCGHPYCVAPAHVDDTTTRNKIRSQLRGVLGMATRPAQCKHGHDQAVHGLFEPDGTGYCGECKRTDKQRAHARRAS